MRHQKKGKKLNRNKAERKGLYANLISSVILHGRIKTTEVKAKAVRPLLEKTITAAKTQTLSAKRRANKMVTTQVAQKKLFQEVAGRFSERSGGYTRIIKLGPRFSDQTKMAFLELVDYKSGEPKEESETKK
ncbi:50S ribosomal protein L17 [candidate division WWE3 bacterium CG_4_9_14_3_um_filter_43_9]|uniref:Large ribosomal subunit protein bL17 n=1 Tax=candidate division WWE3 bacterium CG_4_9_14_3_um_filter_43_9 TaxID=1975082 RepID=A0A2M7WYQ4_UNCKA|nr:MAG: 50S ribosomal protein L17 [candidate division WWE3 bacterium CG_4_9_14_3_um_filter_43_9]